ncbi:MAG: hypothetical protein AAGJ95_05595, partial [Cyanobacteria bacterium J06554_11]
ATTTPKFPVSLAIRMSMSIPFLFKPIILPTYRKKIEDTNLGDLNRSKDSEPGMPLGFEDLPSDSWMHGIWVDGGMANNIPMSIFEKESLTKALSDKDIQFSSTGHKVLGVRLDLDKKVTVESGKNPVRIFSFWDLLISILRLAIGGAGESGMGFTSPNRDTTIELPTRIRGGKSTESLSLFEFEPPEKLVKDIAFQNYKLVADRLGLDDAQQIEGRKQIEALFQKGGVPKK